MLKIKRIFVGSMGHGLIVNHHKKHLFGHGAISYVGDVEGRHALRSDVMS